MYDETVLRGCWGFYTLRGPFEDVFAPSVVISRADGQVFAYANDLKWFIYTTQRKNNEEIFDEIIQKAEKKGKRKVARYVRIRRGDKALMPCPPPPRHELLEGARDTRQRMDNKQFKERSQGAQCTSIG
jgi:hypothetical protein